MTEILQNDPRLKSIPKEKLIFLERLFFDSKPLFDGHDKNPKELLPFLISLKKMAEKNNMTFTQEETNLIIEVIKENSSAQEAEKISLLLNRFNKKGKE